MKIGFGCDHAGVELKEALMAHLEAQGHECIDYGTKDSNRVDYPDYGRLVAEKVVSKEVEKGVLICGTGIGISLAANKVHGIRAAVCSEPYSAQMSVRHNNANIIAVGARVVGGDLAKMIVDAFFTATFEGGRHELRVEKIMQIEC
ncbi:MAG: ribose 5-phosphate isomerase B [Ndongobacter sp.]|nr:ribose 5-phosphate isomerase B [Ndongobacter sp.]